MRGMPNRKCHNAVVDSIVEIAQQWNTFLLVVAHFELSNRMMKPKLVVILRFTLQDQLACH
jgi:hypothetical protein